MGMAASQARYLALTGRMNDIEYQGQQINQQRTTLSTQINELYNSLLDMSVPTPPSQTDFSKTVYSGQLGATKFTMGTVRPTGNDNYSVDINYSMAGNAMRKSTQSKTLIDNTPKLTYSAVERDDLSKVFTKRFYTQHNKSEQPFTPDDSTPSNKNIMILTTVGEYKKQLEAEGPKLDPATLKFTDKNGREIGSIDKLKDDEEIYVACNVADIDGSGCSKLITKDGENYTNVFEDTIDDKAFSYETNPGYSSGSKLEKENIKALGLYEVQADGHSLKEITSYDDLIKALDEGKVVKQSANGKEYDNPYYSTDGAYFLVKNGSNLVSLFTLKSDGGQETLKKCGVSQESIISGIRHSFNISENEMDDSDLLDSFSVYAVQSESGTFTPYFIRNTEISNVNDNYTNIPTYEYDPAGTYTEAVPKDDCKLEFDAYGRITKIGIPNNGDYDWVELTVSTEVDQMAYEEAMKDYNYEKIVYDKRQEEINLKTSIVQQQDKNLELKLTRLDNERNALNTELEAVKKVVSDNIQKTYKTFSG